MNRLSYTISAFLLAVCLHACSDFIEIDPPRTDLVSETVFTNNKTANAALIDIYADMAFAGFASGNGFNSFTLLASFSSDDWVNMVNPLSPNHEFSENELQPINPFVTSLWTDLYRYIYKANAVIEGLERSAGLVSTDVMNQLMGEAKFVRAFCHFYLVNLWGDVPLVLSTDYQKNKAIGRFRSDEVYQQIVADLNDARQLLPQTYAHAQEERVRPNRWTAVALLARVHLFLGDWTKAEEAATEVIDGSSLYELSDDITQVFLKNSRETLWQLHSISAPKELPAFIISTSPTHGALRSELVGAFEEGDLRFTEWVGQTAGPTIYYFVKKYRSINPVLEYTTVIRFSELYLIRAEARAELGLQTGAIEDLNTIRARAGLGEESYETKEDVIAGALHEKRLEYFCEWGHRWLDLKRRGKAGEILGSIKPLTWQDTDVLYPIPEDQMQKDPAMIGKQNPGY